MSTRPFAIFQDAPNDTSAPKLSATAAANILIPRPPLQENVRSLETVLSPTLEKENRDPITGLAAQPTTIGKKRKMSEVGSVLATKILAPPSSSSAKPAKSRELKRRASTSSASGKFKTKPGLMRKGSEGRFVLGSTENASSPIQVAPTPRALSRSLSRQSTTLLGTVPEEHKESTDDASNTIEQALIDSRCYELTVKPLADLSAAYLQSSEKLEVKDEDLIELRTVKEGNGFESQIRDYFTLSATLSLSRSASMSSFPSTSSISTSAAASSKEDRGASFAVLQGEDEHDASSLPSSPKKARKCFSEDEHERSPSPSPKVLSTPERKELYASFTFTTPKSSPTKSK